MTRKRYIKLVRAILTKAAVDCQGHNVYKGWENMFRNLSTNYRKTFGTYSYAERFEKSFLKSMAHDYGVGGY